MFDDISDRQYDIGSIKASYEGYTAIYYTLLNLRIQIIEPGCLKSGHMTLYKNKY